MDKKVEKTINFKHKNAYIVQNRCFLTKNPTPQAALEEAQPQPPTKSPTPPNLASPPIKIF